MSERLCISPILDRIREEGVGNPFARLKEVERYSRIYIQPHLEGAHLQKHKLLTNKAILLPVLYLTDILGQNDINFEDVLVKLGITGALLTFNDDGYPEDEDGNIIRVGVVKEDPDFEDEDDDDD